MRGLERFIKPDPVTQATLHAVIAHGAFEPLVHATLSVCSNITSRHGDLVMAADAAQGDKACPLCTVIALCTCALGDKCPWRDLPDVAADAELREAKRRGLVKAVQA